MNHKLTHFQGVMQVQQIQEPTRLKKKKHDTSKRGKISHFSRKSRRNLLNKILKLEHRDGYYFVTLTYQENDKAFTEWKKNLNHFYSSLRYHYPKMGFLEVGIPKAWHSPFSFATIRPYYPFNQGIEVFSKRTLVQDCGDAIKRVSTSWNRHPSGEKYQAERILSGYVSTKGCERTNGHIERQNMGRKRLKEYAVY